MREHLAQLPPRRVALAEDETDLRLFPPLRAGWTLRGQPAPVPISGGNAKRVLFGTMNILTGHRLFLARRQQRSADCQAFLEEIHEHCRGWHVSLLLDEDSSHNAGDTQELAEALDLELLRLPKRSPHLNPMDHLWRHGKAVMSAESSIRRDRCPGGTVYGLPARLVRSRGLAESRNPVATFWLKW